MRRDTDGPPGVPVAGLSCSYNRDRPGDLRTGSWSWKSKQCGTSTWLPHVVADGVVTGACVRQKPEQGEGLGSLLHGSSVELLVSPRSYLDSPEGGTPMAQSPAPATSGRSPASAPPHWGQVQCMSPWVTSPTHAAHLQRCRQVQAGSLSCEHWALCKDGSPDAKQTRDGLGWTAGRAWVARADGSHWDQPW